MNWFRDLKTSVKVIALVVLMALFMGGVGYVGYHFNQKANERMTYMYTNRLMAVQALNDARARSRATEVMTLEVLLAPLDKLAEGGLLSEATINIADFDKAWAVYTATILDPYESERVPQIIEALKTYRTERSKAIGLAQAGNKQEAYQYFESHAANYLNEVNRLLVELADYNVKAAEELKAQNDLDFARATKMILAFPIVAMLVFGILGYMIARMIANPLVKMLTTVQEVAKGNLSLETLKVRSKDEVGQLGSAFNTMTLSLRNLIQQVSESSEQVAASSQELLAITEQNSEASNQITVAIEEVATGSESQASAVTETASAIEQLSASTQEVAATSNMVAQLTDKTYKTTDKGQEAIDKVIVQMNSISRKTGQVQEAVQKLASSSDQINDIINVITGITDQTNLLALNAAIEAARAGEQGRGFAVVAEEVRKLAEQSRGAAQQISTLIQDNGKNIDEAVRAMDEEINDVQVGIDIVDTAGKSFREITELVHQVSNQVHEISATTEEMASGTEQIVSSVQEVDQISKNTADQAQAVSAAIEEQTASLEQITSSSQGLATMAQDLQNAVRIFKL